MATYNGHKNWTHWNVALWLGGDEGLYRFARDAEGLPERHCLACGTDFNTRLGAWRGNTGIEVVLYVAGLVPGLVYSIWRRGGTPQHQCPACGLRHTVPYGSPAAAANRRKLGLGTVKS